MSFVSEKKFENVNEFNDHLSQVIDWIEMGKFQGKKIEWNPNGEHVAQIDTLIKMNSDYLKPDPDILKRSELEQELETSKRTKTFKRLNKLGRALYEKQEPWEQIGNLIKNINKHIFRYAPLKSFEYSLPPTVRALIFSMLPALTDEDIKESLITLRAFMVTDHENPAAMYHWISRNRIPLEKLDLKEYEIESIVSNNPPQVPTLTYHQKYLSVVTIKKSIKKDYFFPRKMANWISINKIGWSILYYTLKNKEINQITPYLTYFNLCGLPRGLKFINIKKCTKLNHLLINYDRIKRVPLNILKNLTHLGIGTEKEEKMKHNLAELLKNCTKLTSINFSSRLDPICSSRLDSDIAYRLNPHYGCRRPCSRYRGDHLAKILETHPNLTHLNLLGCKRISENNLIEALKNCSNLTHLNLSGCTQITEDSLIEAMKNCPKLRYLNLSGCTQVGDKLIGNLKLLKNLTHLKISPSNQISEDNLIDTLKHLKNLICLEISRCNQIRGKNLPEALKNSPNLTHLNLSGCTQISEDNLVEILKAAPNLAHLRLSGCHQISDSGLAIILKNLHNLIYLDLSKCNQIRGKNLPEDLKNCPKLICLKIKDCAKVKRSVVKKLCKILHRSGLVHNCYRP